MGMRDILRRMLAPEQERANDSLAFQDWVDYFSYLGTTYPFGISPTGQLGSSEKIGGGFGSLARDGFNANVIVFACIAFRMRVISEARFAYQRIRQGKPGGLWTDASLAPLETPRPGHTTGDLLARVVLDIDLSGNSFTALRPRGRLVRLRPDWTTIVSGSPNPDADQWDLDAEIVAYSYQPGGPGGGREPITLLPEQVAHVAPYPDPLSANRGVPWIFSVLKEVDADVAATTHKLKFFQNGASIGQTVVLEGIDDPEKFEKWIETFNKAHRGAANAYRTLFLTAGAKPFPVGTNLQQQDFKATQGAGETRIAAASGIHPVVLGFSEGMQGSSLNAGNYATAKRSTADGALRPLWRNIAGSFQRIIRTQSDSRLWFDTSDVAFLREDEKDAADIQKTLADTMAALVKEGWPPDAVVEAVTSGDLSLLKGEHTGLVSVQLQEPGVTPSPNAQPSGNGQVPQETPA